MPSDSLLTLDGAWWSMWESFLFYGYYNNLLTAEEKKKS